MTKDWELWKDEIKGLYLSKSLHEVRKALEEHGFEASIRAYRMKLEEWGVRKNISGHVRKKRRIGPFQTSQSNREARRHGTQNEIAGQALPSSMVRPTPSLNVNNSETISHLFLRIERLLSFYHRTRLDERLEADELIECFSRHLSKPDLLGVLLLKWQPGGTYLQAALEIIGKIDHLGHSLKYPLMKIFKIIDERLSPHERDVLAKAILAQLCVDEIVDGGRCMARWTLLLKDITKALSWTEKKALLQDERLNSKAMGQSFTDCALVVVAEDYLRRLKNSLCEIIDDDNDDTDCEAPQFRVAKSEYIEVLKDFSNTRSGLDVDPEYYKFALRVNCWYDDKAARTFATPESQRFGHIFAAMLSHQVLDQRICFRKGQEEEMECRTSTLARDAFSISSNTHVQKIQKISDKCQAVQRDLTPLNEQHSNLHQHLSMEGLDQSSSVGSEAISYGLPPNNTHDSSSGSCNVETYDDLTAAHSLDLSNGALLLLELLDLLHTLNGKQAFESKVGQYDLSAFTFTGRHIPIWQPAINESFDLLLRDVRSCHRRPFKDALFRTFGQFLIPDSITSSLEDRQYLSRANIWQRFRNLHRLFETWGTCTSDMTETTLQAILDWWTVLVGPRLLKAFCGFMSFVPNAPSSVHLKQQCVDIIRDLRELEDRDLFQWRVSKKGLRHLHLARLTAALDTDAIHTYLDICRDICFHVSI